MNANLYFTQPKKYPKTTISVSYTRMESLWSELRNVGEDRCVDASCVIKTST